MAYPKNHPIFRNFNVLSENLAFGKNREDEHFVGEKMTCFTLTCFKSCKLNKEVGYKTSKRTRIR